MTGTSGTRSGGLRKGQSPCELLRGLSGFLSRRCRIPIPCVELVPEPEDSSPVLTWILGYVWSLPRGVSHRLERGHARALSSGAVTAGSRFPSRGLRDVWLSFEAFTRGLPTGLSHVPPWSESILGLKVEQCREYRFPWNGLRHLGDSGNGGTTLEFLSPFLWRAPPLEMRREPGNSFPTTQGNDPSSRASRQKRGSSGCGRDSRASSRVETGMSGNFLSCSKGVKDPLEVPEIRCN